MACRLLRLLLSLCAFCVIADTSAVQAAGVSRAAQGFTYRSPEGIVFTVTADGLSSIRQGDVEIASGSWSPFNAEGWFKDSGSSLVKTDKWLGKSLSVIDDHHVRVRQEKGDIVCVADYIFAGGDVTVSTRIENNNPSEPLNVVGFSGLSFHFRRPPTGLMPVQHITYFQAHGVQLCHPGIWSPIGGSYAEDGHVGIGTSPCNTGLMRTLTLWDYADWNPGKRETLPERNLIYFAVGTTPARGAATFDMKLRVSSNQDWRYLMAPYREHFQRTYGPAAYHSDGRWIATDYLNHSREAIKLDNPYGFQGGHRRIDTAEGVKLFCDSLIPTLQVQHGQGVIVWGQGGEEPRGAMYRPDFDVLPPEVEANWKTLSTRMKAAGLKIGVATRPRDMAVRLNWKEDEVISINPDDAGHREMLWRRFDNMIKKGCTLFYLDSFGDSFEDVKLMRYLRSKLGPDVLTFAEHQCDAILPYSGGYSETTFEPGAGGQGATYRLWSGIDNWEIYRWLVPGAQMAARLYEVKGKIPPDFESVDRYFYRNTITPLLPVSDMARASGIGELQSKLLK